MLEFFFTADAPDGGLGYRNGKDSRLGLFVAGTPEDYYLAIGALQMCHLYTERPLFVHKLMEKVIVCDTLMFGKTVQIKVNEDALFSLAKDEEDPMQEIREDLDKIYEFLETAKEHEEAMISDVYRDELLSFLQSYIYHLSLFFMEDPLSFDIDVIDLERVQGLPNMESANESMKQKHAMLYGCKEGRHPLE